MPGTLLSRRSRYQTALLVHPSCAEAHNNLGEPGGGCPCRGMPRWLMPCGTMPCHAMPCHDGSNASCPHHGHAYLPSPCCMPFRPCPCPCWPGHARPCHALPCHGLCWPMPPQPHGHLPCAERFLHGVCAPSPGVLYREMGNMERAMQCYQAALNARPNFPQARALLGMAHGTLHVHGHGMHRLSCKHMPCTPAPWCIPTCCGMPAQNASGRQGDGHAWANPMRLLPWRMASMSPANLAPLALPPTPCLAPPPAGPEQSGGCVHAAGSGAGGAAAAAGGSHGGP